MTARRRRRARARRRGAWTACRGEVAVRSPALALAEARFARSRANTASLYNNEQK